MNARSSRRLLMSGILILFTKAVFSEIRSVSSKAFPKRNPIPSNEEREHTKIRNFDRVMKAPSKSKYEYIRIPRSLKKENKPIPSNVEKEHSKIENFDRVMNASSKSNYESIRRTPRYLRKGIKPILIGDTKIWFEGILPLLDVTELLAFEGSTAISLSGLVSEASLAVKVTGQSEEYIVCDFILVLEEGNRSSPANVEKVFRDLLHSYFKDPSFIKSYFQILNISLPSFLHVSNVSLSEFSPEPSSAPSLFPIEFQIEGIVLELFGINKLNQFEWHLLKTTTEEFLINQLKSELGYIEFKQVTVTLPKSDVVFSKKLRVVFSVAISVFQGFGAPINKNVWKNILSGILTNALMSKQQVYLDMLSVLRKNIHTYRISLSSPAPSSYPSDFPSAVLSQKPSYKPSRIPTVIPFSTPSNHPSSHPSPPTLSPSFRPSNMPTLEPTLQLSHYPSISPSNFPSKLPISFPSISPSNSPLLSSSRAPSKISSIFPSNYPNLSPSSAPFDHPSYNPTDTPSALPSVYPSESFLPSTLPSLFPSASAQPSYVPTKGPSMNPSAAPTPCQDDSTYRSRYGFSCSIHSHSLCSRMSKVGFTFEEVDELIVRCKKSCNSCKKNTSAPTDRYSSVPSVTLSDTFSSVPSNMDSSLPTFTTSLAQSLKPSKLSKFPSSIPSLQPSIGSSSFPSLSVDSNPGLTCFDDSSFTDKFGRSCDFYKNTECLRLDDSNFSIVQANEVRNACAESCNSECSKNNIDSSLSILSDTYEISEKDSSCTDDPLFRNSYGLSCLQHVKIECENLSQIGFTEEEVKEINKKCKLSCKKCSAIDKIETVYWYDAGGNEDMKTHINSTNDAFTDAPGPNIRTTSKAVSDASTGAMGQNRAKMSKMLIVWMSGVTLLVITSLGLIISWSNEKEETKQIGELIRIVNTHSAAQSAVQSINSHSINSHNTAYSAISETGVSQKRSVDGQSVFRHQNSPGSISRNKNILVTPQNSPGSISKKKSILSSQTEEEGPLRQIEDTGGDTPIQNPAIDFIDADGIVTSISGNSKNAFYNESINIDLTPTSTNEPEKPQWMDSIPSSESDNISFDTLFQMDKQKLEDQVEEPKESASPIDFFSTLQKEMSRSWSTLRTGNVLLLDPRG